MDPMESLRWSSLPSHVDFVAFVDWTRINNKWQSHQVTFWDPNRDHSIVLNWNMNKAYFTCRDFDTNQRLNTWPILADVDDEADTLEGLNLKHISAILDREERCIIATVDMADLKYLQSIFHDFYYENCDGKKVKDFEFLCFGGNTVKEGVKVDWMRHDKRWEPYHVRWGQHQVMQEGERMLNFDLQDVWQCMGLQPDPFTLLQDEKVEKVKDLYIFLDNDLLRRDGVLHDGICITYDRSTYHCLELIKNATIVYKGKDLKKEEVMAAFKKKRPDLCKSNKCTELTRKRRRTKST